ncbi:MAG: rane fusion protein heavy metal efflux system [Acidobacteriota bacterium]|jgi:cobalt-zinc-cadmium efflux system membrane fusion protein|nr:rane fusion protein heavy metal efflux system [Acidobacteriota bacterium]
MNRNILIAIAVAAVLLNGCKKTEAEGEHHQEEEHATGAHAERPANLLEIEETMLRDLRLTTAKVEERAGGEGVNVVGELQADQGRYAEVGPSVTARVVRLLAVPGQNVRAGQVLAEAQSVELGRARADHDAAEARVTLARSALERKRALADRIVPRREVQEAEADLAAAQAELRAASATLQALGASATRGGDASRLPLVSPIAGTVIERNIALGQMIDPEHVAFRIGDLGSLWLIAHVFERDAVRVAAGAPARITLAAYPGQAFTGRVTYIGRQVDPQSRTIPVRVELANPRQVLRPGMSASAWLQVSAAGEMVVTVPVAALQRVRDQWVVFVPKSDRTFEIRTIGRGRDLQAEVEVLSGLRPGETVVVDGAFLLKAEAEKAEGGGEEHEH